MNEEKKKVFTLKRLLIIGVIILLVLAMSPLFWTNLIIEAKLDKIAEYVDISHQEDYIDSALVIIVDPKYWKDYEKEKITIKDFKYANIEKIEYGDEHGNKLVGEIPEANKKFGAITVYLKNTGYNELKKAIIKLKMLDFVYEMRCIIDYE